MTMFGTGGGFKLGTFRGVPLRLDGSWVIFAVLIGYGQYQARVDAGISGGGGAIGFTLVLLALFLLGVVCHEAAHAITARLYDIPVRSITITFWGGYTQLEDQTERPGQQFMISAAGPATSLLFGLALLLIAKGLTFPEPAITFRQVGEWSLLIAALNALPGFPLDGGHMLRAIVWGASKKRALGTKVAGYSGQIISVGIMAWGLLQLTRENTGGGIWMLFIGFFLFQAARQATVGEQMRTALGSGTVGDAMGPPPTAIPADISLSDALDLHLRTHPDATFPVIDADAQPIGVLTSTAASEIGRHEPLKPVREAVLPLDGIATIDADEKLDVAARALGDNGSALVLRNGALAGLITTNDILRWAKQQADAGARGDVGATG